MDVGDWIKEIIKCIFAVQFQVVYEVMENFLDVGIMFLCIWGSVMVSWEKNVELPSSFG